MEKKYPTPVTIFHNELRANRTNWTEIKDLLFFCDRRTASDDIPAFDAYARSEPED